jgi:hypothetical protein
VYEKRHLGDLARNDQTADFFSGILKNTKEGILFIYAGQPRPFCLPASLSKSRYFNSKLYGSLGEDYLI